MSRQAKSRPQKTAIGRWWHHPLPALQPLVPAGQLGTRVHPTQTQTWPRKCTAMWQKRITELPTYISATSKVNPMSNEEGQPAPRWRKFMKSGMHRTGATAMWNKVTWPHEVVYTLVGKPATYEDISIPSLCLWVFFLQCFALFRSHSGGHFLSFVFTWHGSRFEKISCDKYSLNR